MAKFKDYYYTILRISPQATVNEIRSAFKQQSLIWHPDMNPGVDTTSMMQQINEAYRVLSNPVLRQQYDLYYGHSHAKKREQPTSTRSNSSYSEGQKTANNSQKNEEGQRTREQQAKEERAWQEQQAREERAKKEYYEEQYRQLKEKVLIELQKKPSFYQMYNENIRKMYDSDLIVALGHRYKYTEEFLNLVIIELHQKRKYTLSYIYGLRRKSASPPPAAPATKRDWRVHLGTVLIWFLLSALANGCGGGPSFHW